MMDAISFVLGVQSKHLRSTHLKELIFRKDANSAPARKAVVELIYELSGDEIEGKASGTEIHFTRSVSAAGVSSYRLDKKDVTFEVYEKCLQQIGVLVKTRNFLVFQGDVESVASKSPIELTKLFEQISNSEHLAVEYDELLKQRDEAEEHTIFCLQKKKMYLTQSKEVKGQKDEAERYQDGKDELDELKTEQTLLGIWQIKSEMEKHQENATNLREELSVIANTEQQQDDELQQGKRTLAKSNKSLLSAEKDASQKQKQLDELTPKISEVKAKVKSLDKRLKDLQKNENTVSKDLETQQQSLNSLREDLARLVEQEKELKTLLNEAGAVPGGSPTGGGQQSFNVEERAEYSRLREEVAAQTAVQQADLQTLELELKNKQQQLQRLQKQEESRQRESQTGEKLVGEYETKAQKLRDLLQQTRVEHEELTKLRDRTATDAHQKQHRQRELQQELDQVSAKLQDAGNERKRSKQEERMADALRTMQTIFKGVHGRLVDLCRPIQRKYARAVTVAAGKQMDAVVVDSRQTAADCIRYLKDQRVGTAVFLPLDNIHVKPMPERLRNFGSHFRPCIDLIQCNEDRFKVAVSYAVGSTLVCDTLEQAQQLCFQQQERVKVVTLQGHVINKSGAMTGGSTAQDDQGGGDRWQDREIQSLKRRKTELQEELARLGPTGDMVVRQQQAAQETRLRSLQTKIQLSEADLKVCEGKLRDLKQQQELRQESSVSITAGISSLSAEVASLEQRQVVLQRSTREVEQSVFAEFSHRMGVQNIREYEDQRVQRQHQTRERYASVAKQVASLTAQLEYEERRDCAEKLTRVQAQAEQAQGEREKLVAQLEGLQKKEEQMTQTHEAARKKVQTQKEQKDSASAKLKELQDSRSEIQRDKDGCVKRLAAEEISIERARAQLHDVLQKAQVEEVALPTEEVLASGDPESSMQPSSSAVESTQDDELYWGGMHSQTRKKGRLSGRREKEELSSLERDSSSGSKDSSGGIDSHERSAGTGRVTASTHFSQADNPTVLRDSRRAARVDLSEMRRKYQNHNISRVVSRLEQIRIRLDELNLELQSLQPNMHAAERYENVIEKLRDCQEELQAARDKSRDLTASFETVKRTRQQLFQDCFQHVSSALGAAYRDLTRSSKHPLGGKAYLTVDHTEEPYLGGLRFTAMPPMKRFRDMDQLSGGERTMAALALLFSIHSFRQAPFFVLDEVDAALDNVNVKKICNYIRQRSREFQCVVISLKDMFFQHADSLVGVCKDIESLSSQVLTLDLRDYPTTDGTAEENVEESVIETPQQSDRTHDSPSHTGPSSARGSARSSTGGTRVQAASPGSGSGSKRKFKQAGRVSGTRREQVQAPIPEEEEEVE